MHKIKAIIVSSVVLFSIKVCNAQNSRFSQIGSSPMMFNPSLSGRFDGNVKLSSLLSWQKTQNAFMSHNNFYVDWKFGNYKNTGDDISYSSDSKNNIVRKGNAPLEKTPDLTSKTKGYWSIGLNYYKYGSDVTGIYASISPIVANFYSINLARHYYLNNDKYLGIGIQTTYANGKLDESNGIEYDKEISGGGFRYSNKNASNRVGKNDYFDFNVGAYYGMNTEAFSFELGLAMYHLFYPMNDIFQIDRETKLRHRMTLHSSLRFKLSPNFGIVQKNVYWAEGLYWKSTSFYDSAHIVALWSGFEMFKTNPSSSYNINFGFYTRTFRTLMPLLIINLGTKLNLRYSYEFPINSDKFTAYSAERTEVCLQYNFYRNTQTGKKFYKKFNYW